MDPTTTNHEGNGDKDHLHSEGNGTSSHLSAKFEEQFEEAKYPELAFKDNWTLYEQYDMVKGSDYGDSTRKVACFNDLISFWKVWNTIPHSDPLNFVQYFAEEDEDHEYRGKTVAKHYIVNGAPKKISALSLFKTGIEPAWEDPVNAKGGEFSINITCAKEDIKPVWDNLVLETISNDFPSSEKVCGLRLLDKQTNFRVEVWVSHNSNNGYSIIPIQQDRLKQIFEDSGCKIGFKDHKH
jgi:hypothetical protein